MTAHHDVGQQQVNWLRMRFHPFESGLAVIRLDYSVAMFLEKLSSQAAHDFVVFHEQNGGPVPFGTDRFRFRLGSKADFVIGAGEVDLERRPMSGLTVDQNVSATLLDDAVDRGQA